MSTHETNVRKKTIASSTEAAFFKRSPISAIIASILLASASGVYAADATDTKDTKTDSKTASKTTDKKADDTKADKDKPVVLSTITVHSRNRVEKLQDVPLAVSVVTGQELARLDATDISAVTQRLANIGWNLGNQRTSSLSIRGIGKQGQTEAQDPPVGLIVDGVNYAYNALSSSFDFTDIDTIEVARGPQGTLLGKNSSIGVISVTTKRPSFKPDASYSIGFGENGTVEGRLAAGGPVIDDLLAWRGNLSVTKGQGDIANSYNPDQTYTNKDRVSGRVQFLLTPNEDFSARLEADSQPRGSETTNSRTINTQIPATYADGVANNLATASVTRLSRSWFTQDPKYTYSGNFLNGGADGNSVDNDGQRGLVTGSNGATLDLNWNLGTYKLTSITAYKDYHFNAVNDEGTPFDVNRNSGGFFNDYKQTSEEIRLSSAVGGFVDYQTGLFFIDAKNNSTYQKVWGNDAGAWYASAAQYSTLDVDGNGRYLLQNSLAGLDMAWNSPAGLQLIHNRSEAAFGQANWHFTDQFTLTTGLRITHEDRENTASTFIRDEGNAPELNPVVVNNVQLGGFDSNTTSGALNAGNSAAQLALADQTANKYFGAAITNTPGTAYNSLTAAQKKQIAAAKALRQGQIGVIFAPTVLEPFKANQPSYVLSPTYKFNDNVTGYTALQHGEKAGVSQAVNGVSSLVDAEKTDSVELGLKTSLLKNTLVFNAALYRMDIKNYQQTSSVVDDYTTRIKNDGTVYYTSATANIPKVRSQGLEIDSIYSGIEHLTIRFAGAYTDAYYVNFQNSPQPVENGDLAAKQPYRDVSGDQLPGASKVTYNIGLDYHTPVWGNKEFHTDLNVLYTSKFNSDNTLSSYGVIPSTYKTDLGVGISNSKKTFDVNLVVKNLFNDNTPQNSTWNSYSPAVPRWVGIIFSGKI